VRLRDVPKRDLQRRATFKEPGRFGSDIIRLDVFKRDLSLEDWRTRTVETHRAQIMRKVGMHSLAELIHYSIRHKIFASPSADEEIPNQK
jgi:hypothetical protein